MLKICSKCGKEKDEDEFSRQRHTRSGRRANCKNCERIYRKQSENYKRAKRLCDLKQRILRPDNVRARWAVNHKIENGKLPRINTQYCAECGKQAIHYHHHNGYDPEHYLDVVPLCADCHGVSV